MLNGTLYFKDVSDLKRVPPVTERKNILKQLHKFLGHIGQLKLLVMLRKIYYWPLMHLDAKNEVSTCLLCQMKHPRYFLRPQVSPLEKGCQPFQYISMDLFFIAGKIVILAVDSFTKFPEGCVIPNKSALTSLKFLMENAI